MEQDASSRQSPPIPPLAWPNLAEWGERQDWYREVITAYAELWEGHVSQARLSPVSEKDVVSLEARLGCTLPEALRSYHLELGALSLAETLCSVRPGATPIQALRDAYPGIVEFVTESSELALADALVAFGDYLGNGNMFCFHRITGAVYYFDHDSGAALSRFADSVEDYLDALMLRCLAEIHDDDETGEALLTERFGRDLVRKWLY